MRIMTRAVVAWLVLAASAAGAAPLADAIDVSAADAHACAVTRAGEVVCWGADDAGQATGQLGASQRAPTVVAGVRDTIAVASGGEGTCALLRSGAVWCWGIDWFAGHAHTGWGGRAAPAPVTGVGDAVQVALGSAHACAVRRDHTIACWGDGRYGQLGVRERVTEAPLPVSVGGITNAVQVAAGGSHTCALLATREVMCWGTEAGGTGGVRDVLEPARVARVTDAIAVVAGENH